MQMKTRLQAGGLVTYPTTGPGGLPGSQRAELGVPGALVAAMRLDLACTESAISAPQFDAETVLC
jgi:hypothetical protein